MKYEFNWPSRFREEDVGNLDGRRMRDAGVTGLLLAHQLAFGSDELINTFFFLISWHLVQVKQLKCIHSIG